METYRLDVGRGSLALAAGEGAAWVSNAFDGTVTRIDGRTNEVASIAVSADSSPKDVTVAGGLVWVSVANDRAPAVGQLDAWVRDAARAGRVSSRLEAHPLLRGSPPLRDLRSRLRGSRLGRTQPLERSPEWCDPALALEGDLPARRNAGLIGLIARGRRGGRCVLLVLALRNDTISRRRGPLVIALLSVWVTIARTILSGLIAWWHRPARTGFGPLMIAAGFANFLVEPRLVDQRRRLHVRAGARPPASRPLPARVPCLPAAVACAGVRALARGHGVRHGRSGARLVRLFLGLFGSPENRSWSPNAEAAATSTPRSVPGQLAPRLALPDEALARRARGCARPPVRWSLAVLVGILFGSVLVILDKSPYRVRDGQLAVLGGHVAIPVAFLVALLHSRLARSSVGDLFVELQADPAPGRPSRALARALGDPSLTLAYWLPDYRCYADIDGRLIELPDADSGRATTRIDQGARMWPCSCTTRL